VLVVLAGGATGLASIGTSEAAGSATGSVTHLAPAKRGSFLSLGPACACGKKTTLDQFSLRDGRRLRTLTRVHVAWPENLATPSVDRAGRVWMTFSSGPKCSSGAAGCGPVPNSCSGRTDRLNLRSASNATVLSFASSKLVSDAVPSSDATRVALLEGGCTSSFFNQHLVVRDLPSGHEWSLGADATPCHALSAPSWNANGSRLVFAYGPSRLRKGTRDPAGGCSSPRFNRLVIVSSQHASSASSWKLIKAPRQCSYEAGAFDKRGVAAVEACTRGRGGSSGVNLGQAVLVQLNHRGRVIEQLPLKTGWEQGATLTERDRRVLISQSQPANAGYPERDWVWLFNGQSMRLVARYRAEDAARVIAVPTAAP
jgi:hypothetical protein